MTLNAELRKKGRRGHVNHQFDRSIGRYKDLSNTPSVVLRYCNNDNTNYTVEISTKNRLVLASFDVSSSYHTKWNVVIQYDGWWNL